MDAPRYPHLTAWVEENIEETFTYYRLPRQHHKHMKSTNMLERLNEEINKVLAAPDVQDTFTVQALNVMPMTPPQFGKYIADEIVHWTAVARASKIEAE